jgi:hypothetical protein
MKRRALAADEPPNPQPAASNQSKARTARRAKRARPGTITSLAGFPLASRGRHPQTEAARHRDRTPSSGAPSLEPTAILGRFSRAFFLPIAMPPLHFLTAKGPPKRNLNRKAPAATAPQGSGRALRAPACRGRRPAWASMSSEASEDKMESPTTTILELHVSGLREGEAPTFRLQPIGPDTRPSAVYLDLRDFLALSSIFDPALARDKPVALALSCARPS